MATLQLLQSAAGLLIHDALDPLCAASLGEQWYDPLEACMVVEYAGPDERRARAIEEVPNAFESHRQRLERIDSAAVFNSAHSCSADAEGALPVFGALRLLRLADRHDDGPSCCSALLKTPLGYHGTKGVVTTAHKSPQKR